MCLPPGETPLWTSRDSGAAGAHDTKAPAHDATTGADNTLVHGEDYDATTARDFERAIGKYQEHIKTASRPRTIQRRAPEDAPRPEAGETEQASRKCSVRFQ